MKFSIPDQKNYGKWIFRYYQEHYKYGFLSFLFINSAFLFFDYSLNQKFFFYSFIFRILVVAPILLIPVVFNKTAVYKNNFLLFNSVITSLIPILMTFLFLLNRTNDQNVESFSLAAVIIEIILMGFFIYHWPITLLASLIVSFIIIISRFIMFPIDFSTLYLIQLSIFFIMVSSTATIITFIYEEIKYKMYLAEKELVSDKIKLEEDQLIIKDNIFELDKLNKTKDKFFSIIAHDLKSPFSGFLNLSHEIAEHGKEMSLEEIMQINKSLHESAINLYELLENLLTWSRIQRSAIPYNPETCVLSYLLIQNLNIANEFANKKDIEIVNYITEDCIAYIDVPMINTVIRNLISNAIKFTPREGIIKIGLDNSKTKQIHTDPDNFICVFIKDSGIGINKSELQKLFLTDGKISKPGTEGEPSTGLGLTLCKEFIEKHSGKIIVESHEGHGSTFYFTLPRDL
ncbi:MAG: HAMP domain-containing sensor histidine kinase [Candidatus Kapabacteria bacterium]|nr:HAMP domain-containing sensor histidine kinase [Candidatus Kapabacteria bacterium]